MATYIVRETVVLVRYVEAETEQEAIAKVRDKSVADFDEVDCSVPERITAKREDSL